MTPAEFTDLRAMTDAERIDRLIDAIRDMMDELMAFGYTSQNKIVEACIGRVIAMGWAAIVNARKAT